MEWRDEGVLLRVRRHGETSSIVEALTQSHGLHAGVVRGGASRKMAATLEPGTGVALTWRARLDDHIGTFTVEPIKSRAGLLQDRDALAGLNAMTSLLTAVLAERDPHPLLYKRTVALMDLAEENEFWPLAYVRWELALLDELGFGLDLTTCAVSGVTEGLAYISPRTGRAVTAQGAGAYAERLLPLAPALVGGGAGTRSDVLDALEITGFFLNDRVAPALRDRVLPDARGRLIDHLARKP
ncbi:MAG: DNA repair protein RecO [Pseudomonadota bacterium]